MEGILKVLDGKGRALPLKVSEWKLNTGPIDATVFGEKTRTYTIGGTMATPGISPAYLVSSSANWPANLFAGEGIISDAPDQETLRELLGLDPGEEVVSYAVRLPDGSIDVRIIEP